MTVTRTTTEINTISSNSFEDAIQQGIARATSMLRDVEGARINNMVVLIENGNIAGYRVNMEITFVLEDLNTAAPATTCSRMWKVAHRRSGLIVRMQSPK
jgi:flavin-binding protein dodecin